MANPTDTVEAVALRRVRQKLGRWRAARTHPQPIPERLWREIVGVAEQEGVAMVAAALRLNAGRLWQRMSAAPPASAPRFVEPPASSPAPASACVIDITLASAQRIRVEVPATALPDVLVLVERLSSGPR